MAFKLADSAQQWLVAHSTATPIPSAQGGSGPPIIPTGSHLSGMTPRNRVSSFTPPPTVLPKERLFANPRRPRSFAAGGRQQVATGQAAKQQSLRDRFIAIYTRLKNQGRTPQQAILGAEHQTGMSTRQASKLFGVTRPSSRNQVGASGGGNVPGYVPKKYVSWVSDAANQTGLSASLVAAQINDESGFQPGVTSPANAQGLAQFEPGTFKQYGPPGGNPYNPADAKVAYINYMNALLKQYNGNVRNALAAYNAGPANISAGYGYADSILAKAKLPRTVKGGNPSHFGGTRPGGQPTTPSGSSGSQQATSSGGSGGSGGGSGGSGSGGSGGSGGGGGSGSSGPSPAVQQLFANYDAELTTPRTAPTSIQQGLSAPFQWWWQNFTANYTKEQQGG